MLMSIQNVATLDLTGNAEKKMGVLSEAMKSVCHVYEIIFREFLELHDLGWRRLSRWGGLGSL